MLQVIMHSGRSPDRSWDLNVFWNKLHIMGISIMLKSQRAFTKTSITSIEVGLKYWSSFWRICKMYL